MRVLFTLGIVVDLPPERGLDVGDPEVAGHPPPRHAVRQREHPRGAAQLAAGRVRDRQGGVRVAWGSPGTSNRPLDGHRQFNAWYPGYRRTEDAPPRAVFYCQGNTLDLHKARRCCCPSRRWRAPWHLHRRLSRERGRGLQRPVVSGLGFVTPSLLELAFEESGMLGEELGKDARRSSVPGTTSTPSPLATGSIPHRPACCSRPTPGQTSEASSAPTRPAGPRRRRTCRRRCPLTPSTVPAFGTFVGMVAPPPGVATETCRVCQVASRAFQGTSRD